MALVVAGERGDGAVAVLELVVGGAEALAPPAGLEQAQQPVEPAGAAPRSARVAAACARSSSAWNRSSTWWIRIPKRWLIVGSCGIAKTRANLYFSGQVR